jgi:prepilin-type N-terminal cleavage/methylation domain-containing protein
MLDGRRREACGLRHKVADAFTLIELLVVIAIVAILAALALSTLGYVNKKGAESRARAEVAALSAAIESYKLDYGTYPSDVAVLYRELTGSGGSGAINTNKVYFEPQVGMTNSATGPFIDPWGTAYGYSNYTTYFELWSTAGGTNTNSWIRN